MFHEGDLQSGIGLAIQQSKSVACFVRDNSSESAEWEDDWLKDSEVSQLLQSRSVILRIEAGSQEAGFLSAFCPVNEVPALALIHNGRLLDLLIRPVTKDEFHSRIKTALGTNSEASRDVPPTPPVQDEPTNDVQAASVPADTTSQATPSVATVSTATQEGASGVKAKGKQKRADPPPDPAPPETAQAPAPKNDWLEQQRQRQSDARRERERVMAQIEADKAERRARREQEKKAREQAAAEAESTSSPNVSSTRRTTSKATSSNLQVRLLDGGTIRKQFPADASLENDVRPWIDSHLETKAPYTFKQILPPQPARPISVGEEHSTLRDLDLLPSATLVLQPIQTYSDAYTPASSGLLSLPYNAVSGAYGIVSGTISGAATWLRGGLFRPEDDEGGRTLGQDSPPEPSEQETKQSDDKPAARNAPRSNIRVRTLADQRDGAADQQFYNGNSLDFESKSDDKNSK